MINQIGLTRDSVPWIYAGIIITKNDKPANNKPIANLFAVLGWRAFSFTQSQANTGASKTI